MSIYLSRPKSRQEPPKAVRSLCLQSLKTCILLRWPVGSNDTVKDIPSKPDLSYTFTPTDMLLYRFSALTFNTHLIHLDKEYAQAEGYPGTCQVLLCRPSCAWQFLNTTADHRTHRTPGPCTSHRSSAPQNDVIQGPQLLVPFVLLHSA